MLNWHKSPTGISCYVLLYNFMYTPTPPVYLSLAEGVDGLRGDHTCHGVNLLQTTRGGSLRGTGTHQQTREGGICQSTTQGKKVSTYMGIKSAISKKNGTVPCRICGALVQFSCYISVQTRMNIMSTLG